MIKRPVKRTKAQSQHSLMDQLSVLRDMANVDGLYDAADWLTMTLDSWEKDITSRSTRASKP